MITAFLAIALTPNTELTLTTGLICTLATGLGFTIWRLANFVRDLRDELRSTWSFRDQEQWALQMERENRARGNAVWVPDVKRSRREGD